MKTKFFFLFIFLFFKGIAFAQFKFKIDTDFKYYSDSLNKFANIQPPDFSKIDFEMRFYEIGLSTHHYNLYVFEHNKSEKWDLTTYKIFSLDMVSFRLLFKKKAQIGKYWIERWNKLVKANILSIPKESVVRNRWEFFSNMEPAIADGVVYRIELLTKEGGRRYSYSNPKEKLNNLSNYRRELIDINNIVAILNNQLKLEN